MRNRSIALAAGALALVLCAPAALGDDVESGSFTLEAVRASFIGSAGYSTGVLKAKGQTRKFKVVGLGIGGFGVSKTKAWGPVYNLDELDDFVGTYAMLRSGVAVGEDDVGSKRWVQNEKGVKLQMNVESEGLQLNLGADGMVVTWDD